MAKEWEQLCYFLCLFLCLYLYLTPLMEVIQPPSEPDQQEDENRVLVLVLVQKQEQVEVQVKAQQRPVFLDIELSKQLLLCQICRKMTVNRRRRRCNGRGHKNRRRYRRYRDTQLSYLNTVWSSMTFRAIQNPLFTFTLLCHISNMFWCCRRCLIPIIQTIIRLQFYIYKLITGIHIIIIISCLNIFWCRWMCLIPNHNIFK